MKPLPSPSTIHAYILPLSKPIVFPNSQVHEPLDQISTPGSSGNIITSLFHLEANTCHQSRSARRIPLTLMRWDLFSNRDSKPNTPYPRLHNFASMIQVAYQWLQKNFVQHFLTKDFNLANWLIRGQPEYHHLWIKLHSRKVYKRNSSSLWLVTLKKSPSPPYSSGILVAPRE